MNEKWRTDFKEGFLEIVLLGLYKTNAKTIGTFVGYVVVVIFIGAVIIGLVNGAGVLFSSGGIG